LADLSNLGAVVAAGGAALLVLFVHLRGHAEKFRDENRDRVAVFRSRLGNELFLDFVTKFVPQIDSMLKRSPELLMKRKQLINAMSANQSLGPVLHNLSEVVESAPPTVEESKQIKDLTQELLKKFERQDAIARAYEEGWRQEQKVANLVLRFSLLLIALGFLGVATSVGLTASPEVNWIGYAELGALFLGAPLLTTGVDAYNRYQKATSAQSKFIQGLDTELYSTPQTVQTQLK
jgi:regulator of replication initiation timing